MNLTIVQPQKSTIVRLPPRVRAIRAAFGLIERIAPGPGSRWAMRLWCTLPGNAGRRRDERPTPGVRSSTVLDGRSIAVETWGSGDPVYLMHGWGGWRGQFGRFVTPLVEAGFRVIALDAPSHGDSEPGVMGRGRGSGTELAAALQAVAAEHGEPVAVIAHSFGAATTATAIRDGLRVGRLVFVAPGVDPMMYIHTIGGIFGFGPRTVAALVDRVERFADRPFSDFDPRTLRGDRPPVLIIHDRQDKEVPYVEGVSLAEAWPTAELLSTEGLGHQRILRDDEVIRQAVAFVGAPARQE
jgi:pimeloyl-ACP methyl ester carboxylesterase